MIVRTESGSCYEITDSHVRRTNPTIPKRGDDVWQALLSTTTPVVGESMFVVMDSLAGLGPDDVGTTAGHSSVTTRRTSRVVEVIA